MITVIHQSTPKARKEYNCDACEFIFGFGNIRDYKFTFSEWRSIIKARDNNQKIKKGDKYIRQFNKYGNETYTFRAIPEMHAICIKYEYYDL